MTRAQILNTAREYVTKDRAETHGPPEDSFADIAQFWTAWLDIPICSTDVAVMMALLKVARIKSKPSNPDHWIDGAGYFACGGELATKSE